MRETESPEDFRFFSLYRPDSLGAVTHTTVNGFSMVNFPVVNHTWVFSFPWFQRLHAKSDFPR